MYKSSVKPHYQRIRKVKTHSGSTAIQVGTYKGKSFKLSKHIGSSKDTQKITELISLAQEYIRSNSLQMELNFNPQSEEILFKRGIKVEESLLQEAFEYLNGIYSKIGFNLVANDILKHFALMRVLEPASKIKSIELLKKYFGISYTKTTAFRQLAGLTDLKEAVQKVAINYARNNLHFDFSLVFYDVTTLYFETFKEDEEVFRKPGFSKDNKPQQPQILIGLVVNDMGFPIYYDVFSGNTFEGHTMLPVIRKLQKTHGIKTLTIVADAGMLSMDNIKEIAKTGLTYIVGARLGNLPAEKLQNISKSINKTEGTYYRGAVSHGILICDYSQKRASKDRSDRQKQLKKAHYQVDNPEKTKRRTRFVMEATKAKVALNQELIKKDELREGIKGYYTNLEYTDSSLIVARYKDLWRVEKSFRMAKSDLQARPIYHRKKTSVEYHILIVFVALCIARVIEMEKGQSIQQVTDDLKDKWTITLKDDISGNSLKILVNNKPH